MSGVANFSEAKRGRDARAALIAAREVADYRALVREQPAATRQGVLWVFTRPPEAFEVGEVTPDLVVIVNAQLNGLSLSVSREIWRSKSGAPLPASRLALSDLIAAGEMVRERDAPFSKRMPETGLRLRLELQESDERGRVVVGANGARAQ